MERGITEVIVHHSAVDQTDLDKALASFNRTHKERWNRNLWYEWTEYIQYHYVIWVDWKRYQCAKLDAVLRHASNYAANQRSVGICLSWNLDKHPPTEAQYEALNKLIAELGEPVHYHNEYNPTKTCPWLQFDRTRVIVPWATTLDDDVEAIKELTILENALSICYKHFDEFWQEDVHDLAEKTREILDNIGKWNGKIREVNN